MTREPPHLTALAALILATVKTTEAQQYFCAATMLGFYHCGLQMQKLRCELGDAESAEILEFKRRVL